MKPRDAIGSYEKMSQQIGDEQPSAATDAARRRKGAERPQAPTDAAPADPAAITTAALGLADRKATLGIPGVGAEHLAQLAAETDEDADFVAPTLLGLLKARPQLPALLRVDPARMTLSLQQRDELATLRHTAGRLRRCVMDTRRGTATELRRLGRALAEHVEGELRPGQLPRPAQERLRSDAAELLQAWQELQAAPQAERDRTLAQERVHQGALAGEAEQIDLLRATLALRGGQELDQEAWDRAAEIHDALTERAALTAAPKDRRGRGR